MRDFYDVPKWLTDYVSLWIRRLRLQEWDIHVAVVSRIADAPESDAFCRQLPELNRADLQFQAGIEDDKWGHIVIIHELLHVAHARLDRVVEGVIYPALAPELDDMAANAYRNTNESYTHRMAVALYDISEEDSNV